MTKPQLLFPECEKPRAKPRVLMHVIDAGPGIDDMDRVSMRCKRCGHETGWMLAKCSEAKRGIPCPKCNPAISAK